MVLRLLGGGRVWARSWRRKRFETLSEGKRELWAGETAEAKIVLKSEREAPCDGYERRKWEKAVEDLRSSAQV